MLQFVLVEAKQPPKPEMTPVFLDFDGSKLPRFMEYVFLPFELHKVIPRARIANCHAQSLTGLVGITRKCRPQLMTDEIGVGVWVAPTSWRRKKNKQMQRDRQVQTVWPLRINIVKRDVPAVEFRVDHVVDFRFRADLPIRHEIKLRLVFVRHRQKELVSSQMNGAREEQPRAAVLADPLYSDVQQAYQRLGMNIREMADQIIEIPESLRRGIGVHR